MSFLRRCRYCFLRSEARTPSPQGILEPAGRARYNGAARLRHGAALFPSVLGKRRHRARANGSGTKGSCRTASLQHVSCCWRQSIRRGVRPCGIVMRDIRVEHLPYIARRCVFIDVHAVVLEGAEDPFCSGIIQALPLTVHRNAHA